jgi:electron transport complex protein RnfC
MFSLKKSLKSIHLEHNKSTMDLCTETMTIPDKIYISVVQHIGAPGIPLVEIGDIVKVGQLIADSNAFVSAPVHSSVSGKVVKIEDIMSSLGTKDKTIVIETDKKQELWEGIKIPVIKSKDDFIKAIRDSGLVGLGGAAFPTHVKYNPKNLEEVDTLIVNGAECEPYITSDYRTMMEDTENIVYGIRIIMKFLNLTKCYIGIEKNKPLAIEKLKYAIKNMTGVSVVTLKPTYPQGAERVLIYETTGKTLNPGKLPADIGIIVSNISTVSFVAEYYKTGIPLISKRITVDGNAVLFPRNLRAPIGARISDIIDYCGGYTKTPKKIIMGGPMMGRAIYNPEKALIKNNNAILVLDESMSKTPIETECINCGRCYKNCPLNLMPTAIAKEFSRNNVEGLKKLKVSICMECGCCTYVCPAKKQLSMINRLAKKLIQEEVKK